MILFVEGLDNCGKTTLIKQLRSEVLTDPKTISIHCVSPPKGSDQTWSIDHYESILKTVSELDNNGWDIIFDRSHIGEDVWGPLFRGTSADYIYELEQKFLSNSETYLIYIHDDASGVISRDDNMSLSTNEEKLSEVNRAFLNAYNKSHAKYKMTYHIGKQGFSNLFETVKEFLQ